MFELNTSCTNIHSNHYCNSSNFNAYHGYFISSITMRCLTSCNLAESIIRTSTKSMTIREELHRVNVPFLARGRLEPFVGTNVPRFDKGMAGSRRADHLHSPTTSARETMVLLFVVLILDRTAHPGRCPTWCGQAVGCCAFMLTYLPQSHTTFSLDSAFRSHSVYVVAFPCLFVLPLSKQHHWPGG